MKKSKHIMILILRSISAMNRKRFATPANGDYRIEIIARSNGTMDYSILAIRSGSIREIETDDISLSSKKKHTGSIPQSQNAGTSQYALTTNGATIPEDFDSFNTSPDGRPTGWVSNEIVTLRKGGRRKNTNVLYFL